MLDLPFGKGCCLQQKAHGAMHFHVRFAANLPLLCVVQVLVNRYNDSARDPKQGVAFVKDGKNCGGARSRFHATEVMTLCAG